MIDGEPERFTIWIKEAIHIRKEGQQAMNRDEGGYQLSRAYDRFLDTASSRRIKYRKNWVPASSDEVSGRGKNVKFQVIILVVFDEFNKEMMMSILCTTW